MQVLHKRAETKLKKASVLKYYTFKQCRPPDFSWVSKLEDWEDWILVFKPDEFKELWPEEKPDARLFKKEGKHIYELWKVSKYSLKQLKRQPVQAA